MGRYSAGINIGLQLIFSSIDYVDKAKHYWSGELSSIPTKEYLFYGQAIIKEITPFQ